MTKKLLALYGLKWNPFAVELPLEALHVPPKIDLFYSRIEHGLIREGGFALITGDPGSGKSVVLRLLAERLARLSDLTVGVLSHPQSRLADFYRELGEVFGLSLRPQNRWAGFKSLRERWLAHLQHSRLRPVLLIDEAQEMPPVVLSELRLLASTDFDSRPLLSVVLAGDSRLSDLLRRDDLLPLGSRIRMRLTLDYASRDELRACLSHLISTAGNPNLLTAELANTLCDHALGNFRVLTSMAAELLDAAASRDLPRLDEKLYLELFTAPRAPGKPRRLPATTESKGS
jgi:type II secretory pathway predicted ATPase ExeA